MDTPSAPGVVRDPTAPDGPAAGPAPASERMASLDALRGFAVLGILLVNVRLFTQPLWYAMLPRPESLDRLDRATEMAVAWVAQGKFISIFAMMFGVGAALQLARLEARGPDATSRLARRFAVLAGFGLVHGIVFWFGDVLLTYAVVGFVWLLFRNLGPRWLVVWAAIFLAASVLLNFGGTVLWFVADRLAPGDLEPLIAGVRQSAADGLQRSLEGYPSASFPEAVSLNLAQWSMAVQSVLSFLPQVLALFLLGSAFQRAGVFTEPDRWRSRLAIWAPVLLGVGGLGSLGLAVAAGLGDPLSPSAITLGATLGITLGAPLHGLGYAGLFLWAFGSAGGRRVLGVLAPVGRMALTNYLTHTLVFTTLNNGYGGGLYGTVSPLQGLGMAFLLFAVQIPLSHLWLQRFRYGPLEWLWRWATYGRRPDLRR